MRDLDHEVAAEGQPIKLCNRSHGADEGVLVACEVAVLTETPDGAVAEHGLVEDLEEVDPDENGEDVLVGLAADSLVLR